MVALINSRFSRTISLLITIFSLSLPAYAQYGGGTGEPNDPYQIATAADLILLGETPEDYDKHFILTADIDLDPNLPGGKVFDRAVIAMDMKDTLGFEGTAFKGSIDGNRHTVRNLTIKAGRDSAYLGLLGCIERSARVVDLEVTDVAISAGYRSDRIACLVGGSWGLICGCYSSGSIYQQKYYGSISGTALSGNLGGLAGLNAGSIVDCQADVSITSADLRASVGLLAGSSGGNVYRSSASGSITSGKDNRGVGGLLGVNFGSVANCCATSVIEGNAGSSVFGGLVGENIGSIANCFASGSIRNERGGGGLVGSNAYGAAIANSYAVTTIHSENTLGGGLVAYNHMGTISNCFWDIDMSDMFKSDGGVGLSTTQMQDRQTFLDKGWDFTDEGKNGTADHWLIPGPGRHPTLSIMSNQYQPPDL